MTDAAVYVRISSDPTGQALGVARQEELCRELAAQLGWTVTEVFRDNNRSASTGRRRPEYERMLKAVEAGEVDAILAYAPDRLYRRLPDLARFIEVVQAAGAAVRTVAQSENMDLSTAAGRTTAGILGVVAAGEVERLKERVVAKLKANAAAGKPHSGPRPYGWEPDQMTPRETEAAVIDEAQKRVLAGESIRGIYRDLNARGLLSSTGKPWTHSGLLPVIRNPRHAGLRSYRGEVTGRAQWPAATCGGDRDAAEAQWRAVVRVLSDPTRVVTRVGRAGKVHLLSALAVCGRCGQAVYVGVSGGAGTRTGKGGAPRVPARAYRCKGLHVSRQQNRVDELINRLVVAMFADLSAEERAALVAPPSGEPERAAAEQEAARLRLELEELDEDRVARRITRAQHLRMSEGLTARLAEVERAATPPPDRGGLLGQLIEPGREAEVWESLSIEKKRTVLRELFTITLRPGVRGHGWNPAGIEVEWREG